MKIDLVPLFMAAVVASYADPDCFTYETPDCLRHSNKIYAVESNPYGFLQCSGAFAVPVFLPCPVGLKFDPIQEVCDWPSNWHYYPPCSSTCE